MEIASMAGDAYRFDNGTIFDLLDSDKLDWTIYCGDEFPQSLHMKGMAENLAKGKLQPYGKFRSDLREDFARSYVFIEPNWHPFTHFRCGNSQHPLDDVTRGEQLLKEVYEAIRNSPLWEKSLLIITYDEHGGFFDHVAPPTTIDPGDSTTSPFNNRYGFNFRQLGVRVPAVVVSPYVAKGIIDHRPYEHCSVLSTIEKQFGLTNLTKRDKQAPPLDRLLTLRDPRTDTQKLPSPADSNVKCTALSDIITRAESVLETAATRLRLKEPKPIDPSISGFVHVALLRKLSVSATGEKDSVVKEALAVHSEGDALRYLRRIRKQVLTSGPLPG
jgi:phospholipase C